MIKYIFLLAVYNLIFFRKFWLDPFRNFTGEMASTFFPQTAWQGRQWRSGKVPLRDEIYYQEPGAIPFLSTFYPIHIATSVFLQAFDKRPNLQFCIFQWQLLLHYYLSSCLAYTLFLQWTDPIIALFGAITMTYMASSIKLGHPCTVYTVCWIPGIFLGGWVGSFSLAMAILGGYWPILLFFAPVLPVAYILWDYPIWPLVIGLIASTPQLWPFLGYYKRSIRHKQKAPDIGRVPLWKFLDLFTGDRTHTKIKGVLSWEMSLYAGWLVPILALFSHSRIWIVALGSFILSTIHLPIRIPARILHLLSFSLCWMAVAGITRLPLSATHVIFLTLIQGWCLLRNSEIYPWHPFAEPIKKPSEWLKGPYDISKFPFYTGYWKDTPTKGYTGGFSLKETCKSNGIDNPMGEALHG